MLRSALDGWLDEAARLVGKRAAKERAVRWWVNGAKHAVKVSFVVLIWPTVAAVD